MPEQAKLRVVYTATSEWWQIVCGAGEITVEDEWWDEAVALCEVDGEDHESWCGRVTRVDSRHSAIHVGNYAVCQGIGDDVMFIRCEATK